MTGDLNINGVDAYTNFGVCMGDGFLGALLEPPPFKDYAENDSRLQDGRSIVGMSKVDERNVTLTFNVEGKTTTDFLTRLKALYAAWAAGQFTVNVPALGSENYKLYFQRSTEYALNAQQTFCKISAQFIEPLPTAAGRV